MARKEHAARVSAEAADEQSLRMTAKFAARTVAGQIDLRCRVLEFASKSASREPTVIDSLQVKGDRAHWKPAQDWLNQQYIQLENDYAIEFSSLFLLDAEGTQIARAPIGDSIGKSYAFRDYFHGQGHDLDPETMSAIEPISSVNLSATYSSSTSKKLKVAFTVPLHAEDDGERRVAGVLGMSVNLGNFGVLKTDVGSDHIVVLVDTSRRHGRRSNTSGTSTATSTFGSSRWRRYPANIGRLTQHHCRQTRSIVAGRLRRSFH